VEPFPEILDDEPFERLSRRSGTFGINPILFRC